MKRVIYQSNVKRDNPGVRYPMSKSADKYETAINITPDWSHSGTPEELGKREVDFQFRGSGFYFLNNGDMCLVLPKGEGWYTINHYSGRSIFNDLNLVINFPTRRDDR